ncbi:MAG: hypothetical protein K6E34_11060 [Lachnospiraceae bacterium]|nr:hypothetical protein [Lachnospiraceae bacterium]
MNKKGSRFSVGRKMYLFIVVSVFLAAFGMAVIAYMISSNQIDRYFKNLSIT